MKRLETIEKIIGMKKLEAVENKTSLSAELPSRYCDTIRNYFLDSAGALFKRPAFKKLTAQPLAGAIQSEAEVDFGDGSKTYIVQAGTNWYTTKDHIAYTNIHNAVASKPISVTQIDIAGVIYAVIANGVQNVQKLTSSGTVSELVAYKARYVLTHSGKLWLFGLPSTEALWARFSATGLYTDFTTSGDAGYINFFAELKHYDIPTGMGVTTNNIVVFYFLNNTFVYQAGTNPNDFRLLQYIRGVGSLSNNIASIDGDMTIPSSGGIKSLKSSMYKTDLAVKDISADITTYFQSKENYKQLIEQKSYVGYENYTKPSSGFSDPLYSDNVMASPRNNQMVVVPVNSNNDEMMYTAYEVEEPLILPPYGVNRYVFLRRISLASNGTIAPAGDVPAVFFAPLGTNCTLKVKKIMLNPSKTRLYVMAVDTFAGAGNATHVYYITIPETSPIGTPFAILGDAVANAVDMIVFGNSTDGTDDGVITMDSAGALTRYAPTSGGKSTANINPLGGYVFTQMHYNTSQISYVSAIAQNGTKLGVAVFDISAGMSYMFGHDDTAGVVAVTSIAHTASTIIACYNTGASGAFTPVAKRMDLMTFSGGGIANITYSGSAKDPNASGQLLSSPLRSSVVAFNEIRGYRSNTDRPISGFNFMFQEITEILPLSVNINFPTVTSNVVQGICVRTIDAITDRFYMAWYDQDGYHVKSWEIVYEIFSGTYLDDTRGLMLCLSNNKLCIYNMATKGWSIWDTDLAEVITSICILHGYGSSPENNIVVGTMSGNVYILDKNLSADEETAISFEVNIPALGVDSKYPERAKKIKFMQIECTGIIPSGATFDLYCDGVKKITAQAVAGGSDISGGSVKMSNQITVGTRGKSNGFYFKNCGNIRKIILYGEIQSDKTSY